MPLISAATMTQLRNIAESAMPSTARVQTLTRTRGDGGTVVRRWATSWTGPCRLSAAGREQEQEVRGAQRWNRGDWTVAMPAGTPVTNDQRIIVDGTTNGVAWRRVLSVVGVDGPQSIEAQRKASCVETEPEPGEVIP